MNKSPRRTQTHDMRFTSPLILPLSYGDIRPNRLIKNDNKTFETPSCDVVSKKVQV